MNAFGSLDTSTSGLRVFRRWLDAVSDNVANVSTARRTDEAAFQQRMVVAEAVEYGEAGGVRLAGVTYGDPAGRLVHDPSHPLADVEGMVRMPDMDLSDQMVELLVAQRGYQANLAVVERAQQVYQAALQLGR